MALLLVTGGLLGLIFPLGKLAANAGIHPLAWSFMISAGTAAVLIAGMLAAGVGLGFGGGRLRFYAIAGIISYAIPNLLLFAAIPRLGAGFTGIMFTLSPVITLLMSMALGLRRPSALGVAGIALGFAGALVVASTRGEASAPASIAWVGLGLLIPVALAAGNVYRTIDWPAGAAPTELAAGSHLGAAFALLLLGLFVPQALSFGPLATIPLVALAQVAGSSAMFVFFFRLQAVGGPVYLSQIGYVAAAVGMVGAMLFLGETYAPATWAGALAIMAGVALTTLAQAREGV